MRFIEAIRWDGDTWRTSMSREGPDHEATTVEEKLVFLAKKINQLAGELNYMMIDLEEIGGKASRLISLIKEIKK